MKKMLFSYIFSFLLLLFSCNKKQEHALPVPQTNDLKILWERVLEDTTSDVLSMSPLLKDDVLLSSFQSIDTSLSETIFAVNKNDGSLLWTWNDYVRPAPQRVSGKDKQHIVNNSLLASSSQDNYAIDITTGSTIWATNIEDGNPRTSIFENSIFHSITYATAPHGDSSKIIMADVANGNWQDVVSVSKIDEFEVYLETPGVYINSNGDSLIIYQNRQLVIMPFAERVDLYCYNLTQDSILWMIPEATSSGSSNVQPPIVEGDRVYFGGKWDFLCIDIPSGEIIWNHNFYWDFQGSNYLIYNNLIITNLDNGDLIAINKNTGNQVWVNEGLSFCCTELRIYDDRIYFGNNSLYIVNAINGELLYKYKSPHYKYGGQFLNAIAVDLESNRMYTSDGKFLMCFELPD